MALAAFMQEGLMRIVDANFVATVGFQTAMAFGLDDGYQSARQSSNRPQDIAMLNSVKILNNQLKSGHWVGAPQFIVQCHFYSKSEGSEQTTLLPASAFNAGYSQVMLGEFATRIPNGSIWPGVTIGSDSVAARLGVVSGAQYDWAFAWSAKSDDGSGLSDWSLNTQANIRGFVGNKTSSI
jgi:hypothetical protein